MENFFLGDDKLSLNGAMASRFKWDNENSSSLERRKVIPICGNDKSSFGPMEEEKMTSQHHSDLWSKGFMQRAMCFLRNNLSFSGHRIVGRGRVTYWTQQMPKNWSRNTGFHC